MKNKSTHRILIVDDEEDILELLQYNLVKEGYDVKTANNGKKAIEIAREYEPHLIILDIMMPVMDGVETCRQIKDLPKLHDVYVLFLTARSEEYSEIAAFEVGADDYITKPVKPRSLISRIAAILRRDVKKSKDLPKVVIGDLIIDKTSYTVTRKLKEIFLPKKEFELLYFMATNPNKVFNRDDLLQNIWGSEVYVLARTVDVHIRKIREKIGEDYITTVKGVGYKFEV